MLPGGGKREKKKNQKISFIASLSNFPLRSLFPFSPPKPLPHQPINPFLPNPPKKAYIHGQMRRDCIGAKKTPESRKNIDIKKPHFEKKDEWDGLASQPTTPQNTHTLPLEQKKKRRKSKLSTLKGRKSCAGKIRTRKKTSRVSSFSAWGIPHVWPPQKNTGPLCRSEI